MCNYMILYYKENIFLVYFFNYNFKLFVDEFIILIYKLKLLFWENMCKFFNRDLRGFSECLFGEKV